MRRPGVPQRNWFTLSQEASGNLVETIGDDRYEDGNTIGMGRRGPSVRARRRSDEAVVVVKVAAAPARPADRRTVRDAADRRFVLDHPGLVPALDYGVTSGGQPWLATAFYPAGSLADRD